MKIYLESAVECTVDGVGLLEPGKPVEVDPALFQLFHNVRPAEAKFPPSVKVVVELERVTEEVAADPEAEEPTEASAETTEEEVLEAEEVN